MTRGFIYQSGYRIEYIQGAKRPIVQLFGRLESGETFLVRDDRDVPTFYVRCQDEERARRLGASPLAATELRTLGDGDEALRVEVPVPPETPPLRDRLHGMGIPTWEADVRFAMRHLMQRGLRGSAEIHGEARPGPFAAEGGAQLLFVNPDLRPAEWAPEPRVLSLDIETDPAHRRLLSIALYGCGAEEVLLLTPPDQGFRDTVACPEGAIACRDARELLQCFARRVRELDPDVLTGWSVVDFDLTVLADAAQHLGVPLELGRAPGALQVRPGRSRFEPSQVRLPGRVVLDGPALLRGAFIRMERYSLDFVAREVLGEGKVFGGQHGSSQGGGRQHVDEILRTFEHDRERFVAYNLTDARLVIDILERLGLVRLAVQRSLLTGMPMDRVSSSVAAFDFLYMTALHRRGWVAPSVQAPLPVHSGAQESPWTSSDADPSEQEADEDFAAIDSATVPPVPTTTTVTTGGYVLEPEPGLYRYVLVLDFQSLYPSLIRTFQIDPAGFLAAPSEQDDPIVAPNGAAFRRGEGILPALLDDLMPRRQAAKQAGDKVASQAIKILMNSFYGVLGTSSCRFHNPAIANAITSFGRELLLWSKARIEGYGYRVLYGDTDSLFVATGVEEPDEAKGAREARALGADIAARLTADLAEHIQVTWGVESRLQMEFEHLYLRLLLPSMRGSSAGARKRYAGLVQDDASEIGEPQVVFTGMEVVRRDWTDLARGVQRQLYERLFHDRPVDDYLARVVEELRAGEHDAELIYRKSLRKDLSEYAASSPQVVAARKLRRKPGRRIAYVITKRGPEPVDEQGPKLDIPGDLDHEHYVEKQIRPVAEPVLEQLGLDFAKVIGDDRQLELF